MRCIQLAKESIGDIPDKPAGWKSRHSPVRRAYATLALFP
jgi:hypothetical protein